MGTFKELTLFFRYSAKWKHILVDHFKSSNIQEDFLADCEDDLSPKRKFKGIPVLSGTHWLTQLTQLIAYVLRTTDQFVRLLRQ